MQRKQCNLLNFMYFDYGRQDELADGNDGVKGGSLRSATVDVHTAYSRPTGHTPTTTKCIRQLIEAATETVLHTPDAVCTVLDS